MLLTLIPQQLVRHFGVVYLHFPLELDHAVLLCAYADS